MPKKGYIQSPEHRAKIKAALTGKKHSLEHRLAMSRGRKGKGLRGGRPRHTVESLWALVDRKDPSECWPWKGTRSEGGYGRVQIDGKNYYAHRVIYNLVHPQYLSRSAPPDAAAFGFIRHTCDNPACCNPLHMLLGDAALNAQDMVERGRSPKPASFASPRAKLTVEQVREIRQRKQAGETVRGLAGAYGVSMSTISGLLYGRHYQDVS